MLQTHSGRVGLATIKREAAVVETQTNLEVAVQPARATTIPL